VVGFPYFNAIAFPFVLFNGVLSNFRSRQSGKKVSPKKFRSSAGTADNELALADKRLSRQATPFRRSVSEKSGWC
jgi:hypothetical protein